MIAALGDRVSELESGRGRVDRSVTAPDAFWALAGLKERLPGAGGVVFAGNPTIAAGPVEWQIGLPTSAVMESDWGSHAASIAALGHPVRLELMHAIVSGVETVGELSAGEGMGTTGQLYHHLGQLVAQGWLIAAGRGHYRIPPERVVPLLVILAASRRLA